jgi:hypothetical protein
MTLRIDSRRLWWRILAWSGACLLIGAVAADAQRVPPPDQTTRKQRVRDVGPDTNVSAASEVNVRNRPSNVAPPASKSSAGKAMCAVTFDNHTDLIAKTYIDGRYAGTIRPYGELSTSIVPGQAKLYARAEYDDGTADAWGPVNATCRTKYVWRLAD